MFSIVFGPMLQTQVQAFIKKNIPQMIEGFNTQLEIVQTNRFVSAYIAKNGLDVPSKMSDYLNKGINAATDYVSRLFSVVTGIVIIVTTVPIIVYYMLTDSNKFAASILKWFPGKYKQVAKEMLDEIDDALSAYIISRIAICFFAWGYGLRRLHADPPPVFPAPRRGAHDLEPDPVYRSDYRRYPQPYRGLYPVSLDGDVGAYRHSRRPAN